MRTDRGRRATGTAGGDVGYNQSVRLVACPGMHSPFT